MPLNTEIYIDQNSDYTGVIHITNTAGLAMNLDNCVIESHIKKSPLSANISGEFECFVANSANGQVVMYMNAANTSNIAAGTYQFDMKITNLNTNSVTKPLNGLVIVIGGITT